MVNYYSIAKRLSLDKDVKPSDELTNSAKFIGVNPREVIIKARLAMLTIMIASVITISLIARNTILIITSLLPGIIAYYYLTERVKNKAREERLKGLSHAPEIITVLGTSLELNPNLERAVRLVGENCSGRISSDLSNAYKKSIIKGAPLKDSFNKIINEWGDYSEGFKRGMNLLKTSLIDRVDRETVISKGIETFFTGVINELKKFLSSIRTHTLILFSFGTVIPLVVISMLPILNILSNNNNSIITCLMLIINLVLIQLYANYVIKKRPATFSQIKVDEDKGYLNIGFRVKALPYCILLFLIISSPTIIYLTAPIIGAVFPLPKDYSTMPLILGLSASISVYYYGSSNKLIKKRNQAIRIENELLDTTYSIASRLQEKRSFENALRKVINDTKGKEINNYLINAYKNIRELSASNEEGLIKELMKTGSKRVVSVFKLIFHGLSQGVDKSAKNIFKVYEHFSRMIQAEEEHKVMLEQVLSMMKMTAIIFAPLISAFIVIMQGLIETSVAGVDTSAYGLNFATGSSIELTTLMLGFYTITLVIILSRYQSILRNGYDQVTLKDELYKNIITACLIYLGTIIIAGTMF